MRPTSREGLHRVLAGQPQRLQVGHSSIMGQVSHSYKWVTLLYWVNWVRSSIACSLGSRTDHKWVTVGLGRGQECTRRLNLGAAQQAAHWMP